MAAETLHASTQLVLVDVVVEDRDGHLVHGLKQDNFALTEQKNPQMIRNFEEHTGGTTQKPDPVLPPLPPGVFTNYAPVAPDSTLNILLIDALNTPIQDQTAVRRQLLDFLKHQKPGTRVAVFGLTNRLIMLQGFTSDPAVLRRAVEQKLLARGSALLDDPMGGGGGPQSLADTIQDSPIASAAQAQVVAAVKQFEAEQTANETGMRQQYTLDAFNALAHYLANFPGRKNLIWFSGAFPLQVHPDTTLPNPFAVMVGNNVEFRQTMDLLTFAQTAVYPVDARGLMPQPMFEASNSGSYKYVRHPQDFADDAAEFSQNETDEHLTMEQIAADTGGRAFYNTNGLSDAVAKALEAGANYYTLAYTPTDRNWNGAYRNIHVQLNGALAAEGYKLGYRRGYYADDPQAPLSAPKNTGPATKVAPRPILADHAAEAYSRAAVTRGAPTPSDILFKVRVLPLSGKDEDTLAAENRSDPNGKMKPPFRTFVVDYVALPVEFSIEPQSDGRYKGALQFSVFVYSADGDLWNICDRTMDVNMLPETYQRFRSEPVRFQMLVSAPAKQESFLRLIVRDVPTNRYGAVEIPAAEVGHLPPVQAQGAPTAGAPAPAQSESQRKQ
jgi:VWFA-related protein